MNINIENAKRKFQILLIVIIIFQIFFLCILNFFFNKFFLELGEQAINSQLIKNISIMILSIIFIAIDILFYVKFIYRLNSMINTEANRCIIEDFIIYPYGYNSNDYKEIDYRISPLVRDIKSNELYLTYGDYCLSYYNSTMTKMNRNIISKIIFRKDGSTVKIGDTAFYYIRKKVNVNVILDNLNNMVTLNNKKMKFIHVNEEYDIDIFNRINFFEGVVEVEDILAE